MPTTLHTHTHRLTLSLLTALALQLPLAWAIVYFNPPHWQGETSVIIDKPTGNPSNVDRIRIENDTHLGVRWVAISAWSGAYSASVCRSDEEQLLVDEPTWPFPAAGVFPGLVDASKWPASVPAVGAYPAGYYGQSMTWAYAIGWPFLCATGQTERDPATNRYSQSGVIPVPEPKFRTFTLLGSVPLCYFPRWQGCIANTIALGVPLFAVWTGAATLRIRRRLRRDECPRCAYDLSATPPNSPCPECGRQARRA